MKFSQEIYFLQMFLGKTLITLTVALSSHVHKWMLVNLMLGVETILVTSCCRNCGKRLPYGPLGSCADLPSFILDNHKETPDLNN